MVSSHSAPEFASVEAFVQFCLDDERTTFTHEDLQALNYRLQAPIAVVRASCEGYGLTLAVRPNEKHVRGFTTSSNDRWFGPGSCKTYGGAAYTGMMVAKYGSKDSFGG